MRLKRNTAAGLREKEVISPKTCAELAEAGSPEAQGYEDRSFKEELNVHFYSGAEYLHDFIRMPWKESDD